MHRFIKSLLATIVGLLIFAGGSIRLHHHDVGMELCVCMNGLINPTCNHHHPVEHSCSNDLQHSPLDEHSEESCPLHIDDFNISDNQNDGFHVFATDIAGDICLLAACFQEKHVCSHCYPFISVPIHELCPAKKLSRRGPPAERHISAV